LVLLLYSNKYSKKYKTKNEIVYYIFYKDYLPTSEEKLRKFFIDSGLRDIFKNKTVKNLEMMFKRKVDI
jgi:hypothetical protein